MDFKQFKQDGKGRPTSLTSGVRVGERRESHQFCKRWDARASRSTNRPWVKPAMLKHLKHKTQQNDINQRSRKKYLQTLTITPFIQQVVLDGQPLSVLDNEEILTTHSKNNETAAIVKHFTALKKKKPTLFSATLLHPRYATQLANAIHLKDDLILSRLFSKTLRDGDGSFQALVLNGVMGSSTHQSLFVNVVVNDIFEGRSSLKQFNNVVQFISKSFHLNRSPQIRQS